MKLKIKLIPLLLALCFFNQTVQSEELVIVQAISSTKKSFIIRRGFAEGVRPNQEGMFSNSKFSFVARAIEVNRSFSLWKMLETQTVVPFKKDQYVYFNRNPEKLEVELPQIEARVNKRQRLFFSPDNFWSLRGSVSYAFQSTVATDDSSAQTSVRQGQQLELSYHRNYSPSWEYSIGARFDQETETIEELNLEVPTTRLFLIGEISYSFDSSRSDRGYFYTSLGAGIGNSTSTTNDELSSGTAFLLPNFRIGYQFSTFESKGFLVEAMMESISATEQFSSGEELDIQITNVKAAFGFKF